jgi:hypothetical protein
MNEPPIDLDSWTPDGRATVDFAVELLRSIHLFEVRAAEGWLLNNPDEAEPVLIAALDGPAAQPSAVLLGVIGNDRAIGPLVAAHKRGGEGLKSAVERGLAALDSDEARQAIRDLVRK